MRTIREWLAVVAVLATATVFSGAAQASLIGQTLTHECPQCGPPYSESFLVTEGAGPELTPFGQWSLDVEASTVEITWLVSGSLISPLDFILSGISGGIASVTVDGASTFLPTALSFTDSSIDINLDDLGSVVTGDYLLLHVVQVPEPGTWALFAIGIAGLGFARCKKRSAA